MKKNPPLLFTTLINRFEEVVAPLERGEKTPLLSMTLG
jgi:hypothetical protein